MIKLDFVPSYRNLDEYYGDCGDPKTGWENKEWKKENLVLMNLPYTMELSWKPVDINRVLIHKKIEDALYDALEEIRDYKGFNYLKDNRYNIFGGSYNFRPIRGGTQLSTHSWGIAVDINPHMAGYKKENNQPAFIIDAFTRRGFKNLSWDGMHFQACK